jgi:hypothetical protein
MGYKSEGAIKVIGGMALCDALFLLFLGLKIKGVIDWSWWWVTAPLWGQVVLSVLVLTVVCVVGFIVGIIKGIRMIIDSNRKDPM